MIDRDNHTESSLLSMSETYEYCSYNVERFASCLSDCRVLSHYRGEEVKSAFPRPAYLTAGCSATTEEKKLSGVKGVKSTLSRLDVNNGRGAMRG
ncbi:hypothetical protein J6590_050169 [Homalodisca vitripennis]|nr:hypothetical protein J6590_050169 [Homalodisca vitripennis]